MNSCGQHSLADIGFHGSSLKVGKAVAPAVQIMLGGAALGDGNGRVAERVIKVPSKRAPAALRMLLDDFFQHAQKGMRYHEYYTQQTKDYFYTLLKPLADIRAVDDDELVDWGQEVPFQTAIGVGECAGVVIDLVATLLYETEEKLHWAQERLGEEAWADAIYHAYSVFISGAKALLLIKDINCSTQQAIMQAFDEKWVDTKAFQWTGRFTDTVMQINQSEPTELFARQYVQRASEFLQAIAVYRPDRVNTLENS